MTTIADFDLSQIGLILIGATVSFILSGIGWLFSRFFKRIDQGHEKTDLATAAILELKTTTRRTHERISEAFAVLKELETEVRSLRDRVISLEAKNDD